MKTLYLLRHAHAESKSHPSDIARNLDETGKQEAKRIGNALAKLSKRPQLIISSNANRTVQTSEIVADVLHYPTTKIFHEPKIYHIEESEMLELVKSMDDKLDIIMLTGHNPSISGFAQILTGSFHEHMATGSVVIIEFETDSWESISPRKGKLVSYMQL